MQISIIKKSTNEYQNCLKFFIHGYQSMLIQV